MLIHLKTLGCRLNEAELETWANTFQQAGHQITSHPQAAQLIVLNSCAVTQDAARKSRNLIRRIHRENPQAKLVVSGCYATLNQQEAEELMGVDLVVSNQEKQTLVEKALTGLDLNAMPAMATEPGESSLFTRGRQRAFIKVQDGCRYRCTFCIVTVARGEERSRSVPEIIEEINTLYRQGIQEVVLTGVHLGGYGSDLNCQLTDLITAILQNTDIPRIRLGSLEPWEFSDAFFGLFENPRLMPHLHLPLQSGSDSVLKRMARRCKTTEYTDIVKHLRQLNASFNITTDIIAGFPGETESEWQESIEFIQQTGFGDMHIFTYSRREGTKAAGLSGQISKHVKQERSRQLHAIAEDLKRDFLQSQLDKEFAVLWEGYREPYGQDKQLVFGYTPNYIRAGCVINNEDTMENQIIFGRTLTIHRDHMRVELV